MEWLKKNKFWIALVLDICLVFVGVRVSFLLSFLFIWMNYSCAPNMKKMLILDAVLLVSTQTCMWLDYIIRLKNTELVDIGASLTQMFNILAFLADVLFILVMVTWSFIMNGKRKAAWITGSIVCASVLFVGILRAFYL